MNAIRLTTLSLLLALPLASAFAQAASRPATSATREQIKAETREALREGDFDVGDTGRKAYEVAPNRFPRRPTPPGETRQQVKDELKAARANGDIPVGDTGDTPRDIDPRAFPPQPFVPGLTRGQVKQEARDAVRAGNIQIGETGETLAQENPSRYAGSPAVAPKLHLLHKASAASAAASSPAR